MRGPLETALTCVASQFARMLDNLFFGEWLGEEPPQTGRQ